MSALLERLRSWYGLPLYTAFWVAAGSTAAILADTARIYWSLL